MIPRPQPTGCPAPAARADGLEFGNPGHWQLSLVTENFFKGGIDTVIMDLYNHWPNPDAELAIFSSGPHQGVAALAQIFTPDRMAAR